MSGRHASRHAAPSRRKVRLRWPIAILAIMVLAAYALYSVRTWSNLDEGVTEWTEQTRMAFDSVSDEIRQPAEDRPSDVTELRSRVARIGERGLDVCRPSAAVRWQSSFGAGQESRTMCRMSVSKVDDVADKLDVVAQYLQDEAAAAEFLDTMAGKKTEIDEREWKHTVAAWKKVRKGIEELDVSAAFKPTRKELLSKIDQIDAAWNALIKAHKAKSLDKFESSKSKLTHAYEGLGRVSDNSARRLAELDQAFIDSYEEAYADAP